MQVIDPSTTNNETLDNFLLNLQQNKIVDGILLMGSTANGNMNDFSDIDITLIVTEKPKATLGITTFVENRFTEVFFYTKDEIENLLAKNEINPDKKEGWVLNWIRDGRIIVDKSGLLEKVKQKSLNINLDTVFDNLIISSYQKVNYNLTQNKRYFLSGNKLHLQALEIRLLYCLAEVFVAYSNIRRIHWKGEKLAIKWLEEHDREFLGIFQQYLKTSDIKEKMDLYEKLADFALKPMGGIWHKPVVSAMPEGEPEEENIKSALSYWKKLSSAS